MMLGILLLGFWLIATGLVPLLKLTFARSSMILNVLAVAAGILLLLLAHFGKEGKAEPVTPKMSQETLAAMVGTTRSRISYFMNRFRKLGFIHYNGGLQVHSSLLTVVLRD